MRVIVIAVQSMNFAPYFSFSTGHHSSTQLVTVSRSETCVDGFGFDRNLELSVQGLL